MAACALLCASSAAAQAYKPPRTPYGAPDLGGLWANSTRTSLQRSPDFKALVATPEEIASSEARYRARMAKLTADADPNAPAPPPGEDVGDLESEWFDPDRPATRIDGQVRSSLIVEPEDGRIPWTDAGLKLIRETAAAEERDFSHPEVRAPDERCLTGVGGTSGPPMMPGGYNNHLQIVQTRDVVAILVEMNHDTRIVRLNDRHGPEQIKTWLGDSIGWWEGDTLVVETVGQHPAAAWRFRPDGILLISSGAKITERFRRISPTEMFYGFTVEDPAMLKRPWRAESVLYAAKGPLHEYACHEGNYSLPNILAGARAHERQAAGAPR
jgi:hypothetical protein